MYDIPLNSKIIKSMTESFLPHISSIPSVNRKKILIAVGEKVQRVSEN